ncbi:hypothetical protein GIX45_18230 [Erwinia sp. CPCC 100877]|nr:hypothetical protein [Erwinia sp. CPCC 100877]
MTRTSLSLRAARRLHLAAQGLLLKPRRTAGPQALLSAISRMSLLQIDTIHVVARSPYLVLFSRLGFYPMRWLDEALARGDLIEYWAHEACFLPRQDFVLVRHRMLEPEKMGWKYQGQWMREHQQEIEALLSHIENHGPVRAADFEHPCRESRGWWDWKPHKRHLEGLFTDGRLMVRERRNFQRVYDLTHRVMPDWRDDRDLLPRPEAERRMLENSARSLGIFRPAWLADYYRLRHVALASLLDEWRQRRKIIPVDVEGLGEMWVHHSLAPLLDRARSGRLRATHGAVLSPFDPVVWDRKRVLQLFGFRYRLECYTPAAKRQYGYFVLPLLWCGELVGRMDARMVRRDGVLEIIGLWLEPQVRVGLPLALGMQKIVSDFARWQGATRIVCGQLPPTLVVQWGKGWEIPD